MDKQQEKYDKAKEDILKAAKSISELTQQERVQLAQELFGVATVAELYRMLQLHYRWGQ